MNYKQCILFGKGSCDDFKKYRAAIDGFFISEKLDKSVTAHFQELKVKVNPEEQNELTLTELTFAESVAPAQADKLLCSLMEDEND